MIQKIIQFSVRNKLIIALMTLGLVIWGSYQLSKLPFDALPDITDNQVQIITISPSLGAADIERLITMPIELGTQNIQGIQQIRSFSRFGLSLVTVVFKDNVDLFWARQQIAERINQIKGEIPEGLGSPEMGPITTGLGEIYQYIVRPKKGFEDQYNAMDLRTIQDWVIRKQLLSTPGVADVSSFGGYLKQYTIEVDPQQLYARKISLSDVFEAVNANNQNAGGSYIERNKSALYIRTEGLASSIEDLENIVVKEPSNHVGIKLKEIAQIKMGSATRYGAMCYNDEGEVAGAVVMMIKGENSMEVIAQVKTRMEEIKKQLPEGVEIDAFLDRTKMVKNALTTVETNLLEGAVIVLLVLVLFLGQWRAGWIVASVIPLAMLFAIGMMNLFGVSGNLMSLGALDFGLIVDGAVIVVEGILHQLHHPANQRQDRDNVTIESTSRTMTSVIFGQIIILIVYFPILALSGIEGKMFIPMAQTVSFAIIGAFILSMTYIPMMSALFLKPDKSNQPNFSDRMIVKIQVAYHKRLLQARKNQKVVLVTSFSLMIIAFVILNKMGGEFIPELEEGDFAVETRMLLGTHLNTTIEASQKAAGLIKGKFPEVEKVVTKIGSGEIPTDPMPMEACDMIVVLKDKKLWTSAKTFDELAQKMNDTLSVFPGVSVGFQFPVQMRFNELMTGARQDVVCKIFGENLDTLSRYAVQLGQIMSTIDGAQDVYVESLMGMPQAVIQYNRPALSQYGVSIEEVNSMIQASFAGRISGCIYEGEKKFNINVRLDQNKTKETRDISHLWIETQHHGKVPLSALASISTEDGVNQIQREEAQRRIIVGFNVRDRDIQSTVDELQAKIEEQVRLPQYYRIEYGGTFENLQAAKSRLAIAVPVSLLLIFLLLYFAFGSVGQGLLIYSAIPLSAIGGVFALVMFGMPFSISAGIGFIALFGVAVLNGIVLMSEFNRLEKEGCEDTWQIILQGTKTLVRPILMTAAAPSLGFIPMVISSGAGAEVQKPLALVVIGGIISATILTLFVLPLLYAWFHQRKLKRASVSRIAIFIPIFIMVAMEGNAQNELTEAQCIQWAKTASPVVIEKIRLEQKNVQSRSKIFEEETNVFFEYGNVNSMALDNRLGVQQSFSPLGGYNFQKKIWDAERNIASLSVRFTDMEIQYWISYLYRNIQLLQWQKNEWSQINEMVNTAERAAYFQKEAGAISGLDYLQIAQLKCHWLVQNEQIELDLQFLLSQMQLFTQHAVELPLTIWNESASSLSLTLQDNRVSAKIEEQKVELMRLAFEKAKKDIMPKGYFGINAMTIQGYQNVTGDDVYFGKNTWFPTLGFGLNLPSAIGNKKKAAVISEYDWKIQEEELRWFNLQQNEEYRLFMQREKSLVEVLNKMKNERIQFHSVALEHWNAQLNSGNIDPIAWIQQINQWTDFYPNYVELFSQLYQTQYEILKINIHE